MLALILLLLGERQSNRYRLRRIVIKITSLQLYTTKSTGADYGPGNTWSTKGLKTHPLSIFPEYKLIDAATWMGPAAYRPWIVYLETDAGISGFAVNHGGGELSASVVNTTYRKFLEGANPFDANKIWEQMYRAQLTTGQGGLSYMAMSAVDLALWDLRGKILGRPVYDLIGGRTKDAIQCYVTTHPTIMEHMADKGFRGVKLSCPWGPVDGRKGIDEIEKMVSKARDLFGSQASVMIECYMGWDRDFTAKVAERVKKYEVDWIEDPLLGDNATCNYRELRTLIKPTQLAIGNLMWGHNRFHSLINEDGADVIQPELQWAGGLTAGLRIAAMARGKGLPVIPHSAGVYSYHFTMAHTEAPFAEYYVPGDGTSVQPKRHVIIGEPAPVDGHITLTDEPGFGIDIDRDLLVPFE